MNDKKTQPAPSETRNDSSLAVVPVKPKEVSNKTKPVKAEPLSINCELVGKSPKEQGEILRRCVGLMDGTTPGKPQR